MIIEEVNIDSIIPYQFNNKNHDLTQIDRIANSIKEFGFIQPLVIDQNNILIIGHGRLEASKKLGLKTVPVLKKEDLTEKQIKKLRILDNKLNESERNIENLKLELEDIGDLNIGDIKLEIEDVFPELKEDEEDVEIKEDEIPEVQTAKIVGGGDLFLLGEHRLMCGDATKIEDIEELMNGEKVDLIFTDPPYGNGKSGRYGRGQLGVRTIMNDEDLSCFNSFIDNIPTDKIIYFLQRRTLVESLQKIKQCGLKINTVGVWDKKNAGLNGGGGISEQREAIIFAGNIKYKKFGGNVFSITREQHKREESPHPHQKPLKLLGAIFDFIDGAEKILDPFGGSGSTLIACEQLNRKCFMLELDPKYCEVIIKRFHKLNPTAEIKCLNREIDIEEILED